MCTIECSAIDGKRPTTALVKSSHAGIMSPLKAFHLPSVLPHSSISTLIRAPLCALMYFNQAHLLLPSILQCWRAWRVAHADALKSLKQLRLNPVLSLKFNSNSPLIIRNFWCSVFICIYCSIFINLPSKTVALERICLCCPGRLSLEGGFEAIGLV